MGDSSSPTPYSELRSDLRSKIKNAADFADEEEVLVALVRKDQSWFLITTNRLIWAEDDEVHRLFWHEVQGVQPPKQDLDAVIRGKTEKLDMKSLEVYDNAGVMHSIQLASGPSYFLAWSAILALCDLTRPPDMPKI